MSTPFTQPANTTQVAQFLAPETHPRAGEDKGRMALLPLLPLSFQHALIPTAAVADTGEITHDLFEVEAENLACTVSAPLDLPGHAQTHALRISGAAGKDFTCQRAHAGGRLPAPPTGRLGKTAPRLSKPNDWCAFNAMAIRPWTCSRDEAAQMLRRVRLLARRRAGGVAVLAPGHYRLDALDTVILMTKPRISVANQIE